MNMFGVGVMLIIGLFILSFFITSGMVFLIAWAFGFTFTWKISFGIWIVLFLIHGLSK